MATYRVYCDPEGMRELCALSPYNLKKDIKNISEKELNSISEEIANELRYGLNRPPVNVPQYWGKTRQVLYSKIRTMDDARDAGKSNGYRCIVLIDNENQCAFVLHIYRHSHGENDNVSKTDKNKLRRLVDEYTSSLNGK